MEMNPGFSNRSGFLSGPIRLIVSAIAIGFFLFNAQPVEATGSWGSVRGGFGSGGGAWGGGLLGNRAPVRDLLGRLNSRVASVGSGSLGSGIGGGSGGGGLFTGSRGGLLGGGLVGGSHGGLLGFGLLSGGSRGGLLGGGLGSAGSRFGQANAGWGSAGSANVYSNVSPYISAPAPISTPIYSTPVVSAPIYSAPIVSTPIYSEPIYAQPIYSEPIHTQPIYSAPIIQAPTYAIPSYDNSCFTCAGSYTMEQSYPVGDYGFEPGFPIQSSMYGDSLMGFGSPMGGFVGGATIDGTIIDGTIIGGAIDNGSFLGGVPGEGVISSDIISAPILDGGPIDSMLDNGGAPLNDGISLEPTPAGGEYYDQPSGGSGSRNPPPNPSLPRPLDDSTYVAPPTDTKAVLNLVLPERAKVYINGKLTRTPGAFRSFVSKRLTEDKDYKYQVKAVIKKDGKSVVRSKLVTMRPGVNQTVKLDFENAQTTLALTVPKNAKVRLCGKLTAQTGSVRQFTTTNLTEGKTWKNYLVSVEYEVNGKKRVEERKLDLISGETRRLIIGGRKSVDQVANR